MKNEKLILKLELNHKGHEPIPSKKVIKMKPDKKEKYKWQKFER